MAETNATAVSAASTALVPYQASPDRDSFGAWLRYGLALITRNIWLILIILASAIALGLVATLLVTPSYTADASVQIEDQGAQVLGDEIDSGQNDTPIWDIERFLNTQLEILKSRGLAMRVARKLDLFDDAAFFEALEVQPLGENIGNTVRRDTVVALLQNNMQVDLPEDSRIAQISFTSAEPELSAKIANAYSEEFIQASLQRRFDSSAYARNFVSDQLKEARARLEASEIELNDYARQAGLVRPRGSLRTRNDGQLGDGRASVTTESLAQLNEAANRAQADRIAAESRWNAERSQSLFASQNVLANPTVQSLMTRRSEVEAQLRSAQERYLDEHPTVQRLQAELNSLASELNRTARNVRNSVRSDFAASRDAESRLRQQVSRLRSESQAEQDKAVRYNTLAREADINRSLYEGLLERYRELNASAGLATSNISIVDRAEIPQSPSAPSMVRNLALALLAGLGLAGLVVLLRDQLDDRVRVPEDIEDKVRLPMLGVIPRVSKDSPIDSLHSIRSPISEAYNSLAGSVMYSTREGLPNILLVTSAQPTEGKSITSFASAHALARLGKSVILIDSDLRRPSLHSLTQLENKRGLSSVLVSNEDPAQFLQPSGQDNLAIMTSGPMPPNPSDLLGSPRMAAVLEHLSGLCDVLVIDSSPVLGLADAPMLAGLADAVVFVIESDRGRSGSLKSALRRLRGAQANLVGAVLTKFDPTKSGNRFSQYYGYDYYRYDSDGPKEVTG